MTESWTSASLEYRRSKEKSSREFHHSLALSSLTLSRRSAVVVLKPSISGAPPTEASLQKLVAGFLPKQAIPSIIVVQTADHPLPRNANGKTVSCHFPPSEFED